jgi:hypothetical protein
MCGEAVGDAVLGLPGRTDGGGAGCGAAGLDYCTELTAIVGAQDETTEKLGG